MRLYWRLCLSETPLAIVMFEVVTAVKMPDPLRLLSLPASLAPCLPLSSPSERGRYCSVMLMILISRDVSIDGSQA